MAGIQEGKSGRIATFSFLSIQQRYKMTVLYGISRCTTVNKARAWLTRHQISYRFHDLQQQGIEYALLAHWAELTSIEHILNRRSTTWRRLSAAGLANTETLESAITLLQNNPTLIKRPVLVHKQQLWLGYSEAHYAKVFA